jgi:hypothetical protein
MSLKESARKKEPLKAHMTRTDWCVFLIGIGIFFIGQLLLVISHVIEQREVLESRSIDEYLAAVEHGKSFVRFAFYCTLIGPILIFAVVFRALLRRWR